MPFVFKLNITKIIFIIEMANNKNVNLVGKTVKDFPFDIKRFRVILDDMLSYG